MSRREMKLRAKDLVFHCRPSPLVVTLILLLFYRLISVLSARIGGQPFTLNTDVLLDPSLLYNSDPSSLVQFTPEKITAVGSIFMIVFEILALIVEYGYYSYSLHVIRGEVSAFTDLLDGFTVAVKAVVLNLLTYILVFFASLLLVIPGIILGDSYSMAPYLLMDHPDWSPVECLRESRRLMKGHKWDLFVLNLSFIGWVFLSVIIIVNIFVTPYMQLTTAMFYHELIAPGSLSGKRDDDRTEEKPPWEY